MLNDYILGKAIKMDRIAKVKLALGKEVINVLNPIETHASITDAANMVNTSRVALTRQVGKNNAAMIDNEVIGYNEHGLHVGGHQITRNLHSGIWMHKQVYDTYKNKLVPQKQYDSEKVNQMKDITSINHHNHKFCVYQHINPQTKQIFYIGSGSIARAYETSQSCRGSNYHLYCKNNNLIKDNYSTKHRVAYDVVVEILDTFDNKHDALIAENKIIADKYGIYPLVNTVTGFNSFTNTMEKLQARSNKVSEARSIACVNLFDKKQYTSIAQLSDDCGVKYSALIKRAKKIHDAQCKSMDDCRANRIWYEDMIYPMQIKPMASFGNFKHEVEFNVTLS